MWVVQIDPVAFYVFGWPVRWYGLSYMLSFMMVDAIGRRIAHHHFISRKIFDASLTCSILGVIIGGRLGHVLFYDFSLIWKNPTEIFAIWMGGMSFHGGFLGVAVALWIASGRNVKVFWHLSDIAARLTPIGLFFGRIANFINQELCGRMTNVPWAVVFTEYDANPRHPSQLYEAFLEGVVLFFLCHFMAKNKQYLHKTGIISLFFVFFYGVMRFIIEFLRDPVDGFVLDGLLTWGQILSVPMILSPVILLYYFKLKKQKI